MGVLISVWVLKEVSRSPSSSLESLAYSARLIVDLLKDKSWEKGPEIEGRLEDLERPEVGRLRLGSEGAEFSGGMGDEACGLAVPRRLWALERFLGANGRPLNRLGSPAVNVLTFF